MNHNTYYYLVDFDGFEHAVYDLTALWTAFRWNQPKNGFGHDIHQGESNIRVYTIEEDRYLYECEVRGLLGNLNHFSERKQP